MNRKPFEPTRTPVRAYDPQREVSEDTPCRRCGDVATVHILPGFPSAIVCPSCETDDAERPEAMRRGRLDPVTSGGISDWLDAHDVPEDAR